MNGCPECKGLGRVEQSEDYPDGLVCIACDGTGNRHRAMLLRVYRLGWRHGVEAMKAAIPITSRSFDGQRPPTVDQLIEQLLNEEFEGR